MVQMARQISPAFGAEIEMLLSNAFQDNNIDGEYIHETSEYFNDAFRLTPGIYSPR